MLIERLSHGNRWRAVSPAAKAIFAGCGLVAAFAAPTPAKAAAVASALALIPLAGAGIRIGDYLRIMAPALIFLAVGSLSLVFAVDARPGGSHSFVLSPAGMARAGEICAHSLGGLAALLFLVLTTPLTDIVALLRRLRTPELLLDIMVLCYRSLFVFSESVQDMRAAQAARLGYARPRLALRSLGDLAANLVLQVWERSQALHVAALSRNSDGPLRFLESRHPHGRRQTAVAAAAGLALIALAAGAA